MNKNVPVFKARSGKGGVEAAIWCNSVEINGQQRDVYKASIERRFKDGEGNWKSATSFSKTEIPMVIYCLERAMEAIIAKENASRESAAA